MHVQRKLKLFLGPMQYFLLLTLLYILFILFLPANQQTMHEHNLSTFEYRVLLFAIELPFIAVWFAAFYGYAKLRNYVHSIRKTPEAGPFGTLARGCAWLAWSLPTAALTTLLVDGIANGWSGFHPAAVIIINYVTWLLPFISFTVIGRASRSLLSLTKARFSAASARGIMLLFAFGGVLYCYLIFRQFNLTSFGDTHNPYFMPIWLVVLTIIIPSLYTWFIGLLAAYEIIVYSNQARGVLYRQALQLLVGGLLVVIASSIVLQYVSSVKPSIGHISLNFQLLLLTVFRILDGCGFVLIASGAGRLKKIEEV